MFPSSALLVTLLVALSAVAKPIVIQENHVKASLSRRLNVNSGHDLVRQDQARARYLLNHGQASTSENDIKEQRRRSTSSTDIDQPVTNIGQCYTASIGVGNPPTTYNLIVDTGSANTWIGAAQPYTPTNTSIRSGESVSVTYRSGSGFFSGKEFFDRVVLADGLVLPHQSIGVADHSRGFDGFDGVLGLGPAELTRGTLDPSTGQLVPTVTDSAFMAGIIPSNMIGIYFEPIVTAEPTSNGVLTWGGVDKTKLTGELVFAPIPSTGPASTHWGFEQKITYGSSLTILESNTGIVDTSTTLLLLATDAYKRYIQATGATLDSTTGLLTIRDPSRLESLFFNINGESFEFTANAQLWPRALNAEIGGKASVNYLIVADLGVDDETDIQFVNGYVFHERFYTVYDTDNRKIGFGRTQFTDATTN